MKIYCCAACGSLVFFDNVTCLKCGHTLGFLPDHRIVSAIESAQDGSWRALSPRGNDQWYRPCANSLQHQVCNWMVAGEDPNPFCISCRLNQTIPDLDIAGNHERWHRLELAKRRAIHTILQLRLPTEGQPSLRFQFLADVRGGPDAPTGHQDGLITINIMEADDLERERRRLSLHEPFRTLLGHFRHEVGHYFWDRLIANSRWLEGWRARFGDESRDYGMALQTYYQNGPSRDWAAGYVSAYASAHPWEDWAETWAHYFHMTDTVETAAGFGLSLQPDHPAANFMTADFRTVKGGTPGFDAMLENWYPLTYALNSLNRGMGLQDLYPFVLSNPAIEKLRFIHKVVTATWF